MRYQNFSNLPMIISWLVRIKEEALEEKKVYSAGGCGWCVVAHYVDQCVSMLLEQQTYISNLKYRLKCEQEENKEYRDRYGELDELPEDDTEENDGRIENAEIH